MKKTSSKLKKNLIVLSFVFFIYVMSLFFGFQVQQSKDSVPLFFTKTNFVDLLIHNGIQISLIIILGIITFGIYALIMLVINGLGVGIALSLIIQNKQFAAFYSGFLPHGIIEITGLLAAAMVPFMFWSTVVRYARLKKDIPVPFHKLLLYDILSYILSSYCCIIIAAYIEANISNF